MEVDDPGGEVRKRKVEDDFEDYYPQIGIIYDEKLVLEGNKVPQLKERAEMVYSLIEAYDLMRNMTVYRSIPATDSDLFSFHSNDFIDYMKSINTKYTVDDDIDLEYGLGYDCPPLDGIYDYICAIGGSSLTAARALNNQQVEVAINWCGGWHHSHREMVEGFCYTNDIVLAILELRHVFNQILYIDLDIHHGNGVEDSFAYTNKVFTLSIHKYEAGFYPGSGSLSDVGFGAGKYHTANVPLKEGITDEPYQFLFDNVLKTILGSYTPEAIVVQCGADCLAGDPLGGFNLTSKALGHCVKQVLKCRKPTLILGGGGYNISNAAKCWTYLTSVIIGCKLDSDIPEHEFFTKYGPSYELEVEPNNRKDQNRPEELHQIIRTIKENCRNIAQ